MCPESQGAQAREALQAVGVDRRPRSDVLGQKGCERRRLAVGNHGQADPPRPVATFLDGDEDERSAPALELPASPQPSLLAADPRVVDLDGPVQGLAGGIDHSSPKLVEHQPSGFVSSQSELALQQQRRNAACVGRHEVRRPKPLRERQLCVVQYRFRRQRDLMPTCDTLPASPGAERIGAPPSAARRGIAPPENCFVNHCHETTSARGVPEDRYQPVPRPRRWAGSRRWPGYRQCRRPSARTTRPRAARSPGK